ncbi:hypothetical protein [Sporomusa sp. GT1]|nr:hypothetical protein [Sporomusa sp. GT1]
MLHLFPVVQYGIKQTNTSYPLPYDELMGYEVFMVRRQAMQLIR